MPSYVADKELENMGKALITSNHPNLAMLKIAYLFRPKAPVSAQDGHIVSGMAVHVDDRNWALTHNDFIIEIAKDVWDEATPEFRAALMDHELSHIGIVFDEENDPAVDPISLRVKTFCRRHDIEEFEDVLARHGAYHKGLRSFLKAFAEKRAEKDKAAAPTGAAKAAVPGSVEGIIGSLDDEENKAAVEGQPNLN